MTDDLKMVEVIPIEKGVFKDSLTYFTSKDINPGSVVLVPLRKRQTMAVVSFIKKVSDLKTDIKTSEFPFRKIERVIGQNLYLKEFLSACEDAGQFFACQPGQILRMFSPKAILESWKKNKLPEEQSTENTRLVENNSNQQWNRFEPLILQLPDEERYPFYKSLIREEFAKKHSVLFILPTIHDVLEAEEILCKGIEEYSIVLSSELGSKTMVERWRKALENSHSVLIISTPTFLSIPRYDFSTIIIDKEFSHFYQMQNRPFIDVRKFSEFYAKKSGLKLILGDTILRVEDIYQGEAGAFLPATKLKYRFQRTVNQELIDMTKGEMLKNGAGDFIFSQKLKKEISIALSNKESFIIITARKGLATSTICADCGTYITCKLCGAVMVLYQQGKENIFSCNRCREKKSSDINCENCGSWKLNVLGIGTETTEREVETNFPGTKVFRLDGETAKTHRTGLEIIKKFMHEKGVILLATEIILNYLQYEISNCAIASIDSLFVLPNFNMDEKIFNFLMRLKLKASKRFIIQTRKPEDKIFENVLRGDVLEFYRKEIKERKKWSYPPFKVLIKIEEEGPTGVVEEEMNQLEKFLKAYEPVRFYSYGERNVKIIKINLLIKQEPENWPPKKAPTNQDEYSSLLEILLSLPPRFIVKINPDSVL